MIIMHYHVQLMLCVLHLLPFKQGDKALMKKSVNMTSQGSVKKTTNVPKLRCHDAFISFPGIKLSGCCQNTFTEDFNLTHIKAYRMQVHQTTFASQVQRRHSQTSAVVSR